MVIVRPSYQLDWTYEFCTGSTDSVISASCAESPLRTTFLLARVDFDPYGQLQFQCNEGLRQHCHIC